MNYDALFTAYYVQYRTEATVPASTDDEYIIGLALANEAINRWANYDNTYWKELFTSLQSSTQVSPALVKTIQASTVTYTAPADMREAGGFVRLYNNSNSTQARIPIIEPQEAQFKTDSSSYAYFLGNPNTGFTLHINPTPTTAMVGLNIDYIYYKKPALLTVGASFSEMSQPYFIVHRMLASRFRGSRNPFRNDAKADAEDVLKTMQMDNNSGNWADPWRLADNSGTQWGL